jgi:hypothetical protein
VFSSFSEVDLPTLTRMMRRTMLMSLAVGAGAVIVAFMVAPPLAGLGIALGLGLAILNLRAMDAGVAKVETKGTTNRKVLRRLLGTRTATRLAVITAIAIGLVLLSPPLGMGVIIGLVIFQLVFVMNAARAISAGTDLS